MDRVGGQLVAAIKMLGHWLDEDLGFKQQMATIISKLRMASRAVAATIAEAGFGLPFMAAHYGGRVQSKALAGLRVLAGARGVSGEYWGI